MSSTAETSQLSATEEEAAYPETLLAPLNEREPVGRYLRYAGLYEKLEEARRADDNLQREDWERKLKAADWPQVVKLAAGALATETKDLQVAAWLTEALVRVRGFAGLRDGLRVLRGLHERFWDQMYPSIEDGDLDGRAKIVTWLTRQLAVAVKEVPLTQGAGGEKYNFLQWDNAVKSAPAESDDDSEEGEGGGDEREEKRAAESLRVTAEKWRRAAKETPLEFYERTLAALGECAAELDALDRLMDQKFVEEVGGKLVNNSPGLGKLKKSLEEVTGLVEKVLPEKLKAVPKATKRKAAAPQATDGADGEASAASSARDPLVRGGRHAAAGGGQGGHADGLVRSRRDALERLAEVAAFFRAAEPHSPVSYLVERAIKWGEMPLEAWLADVIGEDPALNKLRDTLGLQPVAGSDADDGDDESGGEDEDDQTA